MNETRIEEGVDRRVWENGKTTYKAWVPEWTDAGGKRHQASKSFATLKEARAWRREQLGLRARNIRKPTGRLTLGEFLDDWIQRYEIRNPGNTAATYRRAISKHLRALPICGLRLSDLDTDAVREAYDAIAATTRNERGGTMVPYVHDALHRALSDAVPKYLAHNPAAGAQRGFASRRAKRQVWTEDEYRAFLEAGLENKLYALWWTIGQTGARKGEALGLDWPDIDLDARLLTVQRQYTVVDGSVRLVEYLKTSNGFRTIDFDEGLAEILRRWRREQLQSRKTGRDAHAVFTYPSGRSSGQRVGPTQALDARFAEVVKAASVRSISIHDVRHTHATLLLRRLVPINVVSERLGHHDPGFTLRTYTHVMPKDGRIAADIAGMVSGQQARPVAPAAEVDQGAIADQLATLATQLRDASGEDVRRALADVAAIAGRLGRG